jgi:hypothetical protein
MMIPYQPTWKGPRRTIIGSMLIVTGYLSQKRVPALAQLSRG